MLEVEVTSHCTAQPAHADEPDEVLQDTRSSVYIKRVRAIYEYAAQVQRSYLCHEEGMPRGQLLSAL
jgi:hypothetical protein